MWIELKACFSGRSNRWKKWEKEIKRENYKEKTRKRKYTERTSYGTFYWKKVSICGCHCCLGGKETEGGREIKKGKKRKMQRKIKWERKVKMWKRKGGREKKTLILWQDFIIPGNTSGFIVNLSSPKLLKFISGDVKERKNEWEK